MKVSLMMAMALFPDAVSFQFVPGPRVKVSYPDPKGFLAALRARDREKMAEYSQDEEEIAMEPITESPPWVLAGMSKRYRKVFIYEEEPGFVSRICEE